VQQYDRHIHTYAAPRNIDEREVKTT